jgi:AraC-like DNA-binding protein
LAPDSRRVFPRAWLVAEAYLFDGVHAERIAEIEEHIRMDGMDATSAAYEVGYESVSQFNREYSRMFGQPPMRDIKAQRDGKVVAINAA